LVFFSKVFLISHRICIFIFVAIKRKLIQIFRIEDFDSEYQKLTFDSKDEFKSVLKYLDIKTKKILIITYQVKVMDLSKIKSKELIEPPSLNNLV